MVEWLKNEDLQRIWTNPVGTEEKHDKYLRQNTPCPGWNSNRAAECCRYSNGLCDTRRIMTWLCMFSCNPLLTTCLIWLHVIGGSNRLTLLICTNWTLNLTIRVTAYVDGLLQNRGPNLKHFSGEQMIVPCFSFPVSTYALQWLNVQSQGT